jgi:hypothetical protein
MSINVRLSRYYPVKFPNRAPSIYTGYVGRTQDVLGVWREYATDVRGQPLPCGHHLPEEMPDETYAVLRGFLRNKD